MKKIITIFSFLMIGLMPFLSQAKVNVVATLPVYAGAAKAVGGSFVNVKSLAPSNRDPHFLDAKPSYVVSISDADLLIYGGLDLESGWLPPIKLQARNPKLNGPGTIDASKGVSVLEKGASSRLGGDIHPNGNPHTWLDPTNMITLAKQIEIQLKRLDPEHADQFAKQGSSYIQQLKNAKLSWMRKYKKLKGKKIITYHRSFSYLAQWTGLNIVGYLEPKPGIPPNSRHVEKLIDLAHQEGVTTILMENFYPRKFADYVSKKTKASVKVVQYQTSESYISMMEKLLGAI